MRWNVFGKAEVQAAAAPCRSEVGQAEAAGIVDRLEARGVDAAFSRAIAARVETRVAAFPAEKQEAVLDGVALASVVQREISSDLENSLHAMREVERMMGAFSGELSKLDEVLEVLAAYVQRMRSTGARDTAQTLH